MNIKIFKKYNREIQIILEFKETLKHYFFLDYKKSLSQEEARIKDELREKLNALNGEVAHYVKKSGVPAVVYYSPPPAVGGLAGHVDFFSNIFYLLKY